MFLLEYQWIPGCMVPSPGFNWMTHFNHWRPEEFVEKERMDLSEDQRNKMTVSMKADKNIEMGIITDVKQELRKASALKVNYSAAIGTQKAVLAICRLLKWI